MVEPTLSPHNRTFAGNIELLRKSKEDCQAEAKLRQAPVHVESSFDRDIDEPEIDPFDSETEEALANLDERVSDETLIAAYDSIAKAWAREMLVAGRRIPALTHTAARNRGTRLQNLLPLNFLTILGIGPLGSVSSRHPR
jgi:hypothetical protein